jgi:hypothetical protein
MFRWGRSNKMGLHFLEGEGVVTLLSVVASLGMALVALLMVAGLRVSCRG